MIKVEEKSSDFNDVLFVEGLVECGKVVEDLAGFSVFGAFDDYLFYCSSCITTHKCCILVLVPPDEVCMTC